MIIKGYGVFCDTCEFEFNTFCKGAAFSEQDHHLKENEDFKHVPFVTEINFHFENIYADRASLTRLRIAQRISGKKL